MKPASKKKTFVSLSMGAIALGILASCGPSTSRPHGSNDEPQYDATKTTIYVSNWNGAYGYQWLLAAAKRFEALHSETSYEEGKKGVQILVDNSKVDFATILANLSGNRDDIFFTEWAYYFDLARSGKFLDITDIATEPLTAYGETKSIYDKFTNEQKEYYDYIDASGKRHIYALPHYQGFSGITYDVDLFEEECLYFAADAATSDEGFVVSIDDDRSKGPDGVAGTMDDGLPATYADFMKLCARMVIKGVTPILWSGSYPLYYQWFSSSLLADYEGLDQMMLNYTFDGKAKNIITGFDDNGNPQIGELDIKPKNGNYLTKQAGRYYALKFAEDIISNNYCDLRSFGTLSHIDAQKFYINGGYGSNKKIGMFIESNYWENEVDDAGGFNSMVKSYGNRVSRKNRRFGFMPFPKATEAKVGQKNTLVDYLCSAGMIKADVPEYKKKLAKSFLQFLYTDVSLNEWTAITGTPKSIRYDITPETKSKLSPFSQSVFEVRNASDVVYPYSNSDIYKNNAAAFDITSYWETSVSKGGQTTPYSFPSTAIYRYGVTAREYFDGLYAARNDAMWQSNYGKYFGE